MPKKKNCLQFESTIKESSVKGIKAWVKRVIFNRHSIALPAGELHAAVFKTLGYKGSIFITDGVGLIDKSDLLAIRSIRGARVTRPQLRFLYVGRLIGEKNPELLINVFNKTGKPLTIAGTGEMAEKLMQKASSNIVFNGFVPHQRIHQLYQKHDVLILPSKSETWGLVVEEAVCAGMPVVVSDKVGCQIELVEKLRTGVVFNSGSEPSLMDALSQIELSFEVYKNNSMNVNFDLREQFQLEAYLKVLDDFHDPARKTRPAKTL